MLSSCSTNELDKREPGSPVVIAGLLIKVGKKVTKKGHKMADFRLEDLDGGVDGTVFPKTFEKFEEALVPDTIVVCRGKLEERITGDDSPAEVRMLLDEVMTVEDALGRFEGSLVIGLEPMDLPLLPKLKALIDKHPGERPLYLRVTGRDGKKRRIRTNSNSNVAISAELAQEIDHILGKGRAHLARQGSRKRGRRSSNHSYARNR